MWKFKQNKFSTRNSKPEKSTVIIFQRFHLDRSMATKNFYDSTMKNNLLLIFFFWFSIKWSWESIWLSMRYGLEGLIVWVVSPITRKQLIPALFSENLVQQVLFSVDKSWTSAQVCGRKKKSGRTQNANRKKKEISTLKLSWIA